MDNEWVPSGVAYMVIGDELARRLACNPQEGRKHAADELMGKLESGDVVARASNCSFDLNQGFEADIAEFVGNLEKSRLQGRRLLFNEAAITVERWAFDHGAPDRRNYSGAGEIPASFWDFCLPGPYPINWAAGDFYWDRVPVAGMAVGVEFSIAGLPCEETVRAFMASSPPRPNHQVQHQSQPQSAGRPPAQWWPNFAEELAVYVHAEGIPDGPGSQERMLDSLLARMAEKGMEVPSRSRVQGVLRNVIARLRA